MEASYHFERFHSAEITAAGKSAGEERLGEILQKGVTP